MMMIGKDLCCDVCGKPILWEARMYSPCFWKQKCAKHMNWNMPHELKARERTRRHEMSKKAITLQSINKKVNDLKRNLIDLNERLLSWGQQDMKRIYELEKLIKKKELGGTQE